MSKGREAKITATLKRDRDTRVTFEIKERKKKERERKEEKAKNPHRILNYTKYSKIKITRGRRGNELLSPPSFLPPRCFSLSLSFLPLPQINRINDFTVAACAPLLPIEVLDFSWRSLISRKIS